MFWTSKCRWLVFFHKNHAANNGSANIARMTLSRTFLRHYPSVFVTSFCCNEPHRRPSNSTCLKFTSYSIPNVSTITNVVSKQCIILAGSTIFPSLSSRIFLQSLTRILLEAPSRPSLSSFHSINFLQFFVSFVHPFTSSAKLLLALPHSLSTFSFHTFTWILLR